MSDLATTKRTIGITAISTGLWTPGSADGHSYTQVEASKSSASSNKLLVKSISWEAKGCTFSEHSFIKGGASDTIPTISLLGDVKPALEKAVNKKIAEIDASSDSDAEKASDKAAELKKLTDFDSQFPPPSLPPPSAGTPIKPLPTYTKVKCDGQICLRQGDFGQ